MVKIFVDSGSGYTLKEAQEIGVELIPLRVNFKNKEYFECVDLSSEEFYRLLEDNKEEFPVTSLPSLADIEDRVNQYTEKGIEVIIVTISSTISSTWSALASFFKDNQLVTVFDSKIASSGMKILVEEMLKYQTRSEMIAHAESLIPRITVLAAPKTLDYFLKGGRITRHQWLTGKLLLLRPIISFVDGKLTIIDKPIGTNMAIKRIVERVKEVGIDVKHKFIACYAKTQESLNKLIEKLPGVKIDQVDDLTPSIASHWGPGAFGFIFVRK